jgi:hypothetical protein
VGNTRDPRQLYPLAKDILEKHSFLLKIEINHFYYQVLSPSKQKDYIVAHSEYIIDKLSDLGLVDNATFESYEERDKDDFIRPHMIYRLNTTYSEEDFSKKILFLNTSTFEMEKVIFKEMNITKDGDYLTLSFKNVLSRRNKGF